MSVGTRPSNDGEFHGFKDAPSGTPINRIHYRNSARHPKYDEGGRYAKEYTSKAETITANKKIILCDLTTFSSSSLFMLLHAFKAMSCGEVEIPKKVIFTSFGKIICELDQKSIRKNISRADWPRSFMGTILDLYARHSWNKELTGFDIDLESDPSQYDLGNIPCYTAYEFLSETLDLGDTYYPFRYALLKNRGILKFNT